MTYRGQVKNGVVVLEGGPPLQDGTIVRVEPVEATAAATAAPRGSAQAILQAVRGGAHWQGDPKELDRLLAHLKATKRAEAESQLESAKRNGAVSSLDD